MTDPETYQTVTELVLIYVVCAIFFGAIGSGLSGNTREGHRAVWLAPVWPPVLLWYLLRAVWLGVLIPAARSFRYAFLRGPRP